MGQVIFFIGLSLFIYFNKLQSQVKQLFDEIKLEKDHELAKALSIRANTLNKRYKAIKQLGLALMAIGVILFVYFISKLG